MRTLRIRSVNQDTGAESEPTDTGLLDFLEDNPEIDPEDSEAISTMEPGERHWIGGGAAPLFYVTRLT